MEKAAADRLICDYTKKLFGFALAKCENVQEAQELSSRMVLAAYTALLRSDSIENPAGYIHKIAENVYAQYVGERKRNLHLSLDFAQGSADFRDAAQDMIQQESCEKLRSEIVQLSRVQREVVMCYYYDRLSQKQIAARLGLPVGTVKWHLFEAKKSLKEGMEMTTEKGTLGMRPIRLVNMGHSGRAGEKGDTRDFLRGSLAQNIAYAAYHQARTVQEIARELNTSPDFVADEAEYLAEYGFLDKLSGGKYQTNVYISRITQEISDKADEIAQRCALALADYAPAVQEAVRAWPQEQIYTPDGDFGFLLWSAFSHWPRDKQAAEPEEPDTERYRVKRKDGGEYIASAQVAHEIQTPYDPPNRYACCGDMWRGSSQYPIRAWQFNCRYDSRGNGGWRENQHTDYEALYEAFTGKLAKDEMGLEKYRRLYEKGYLRQEGGRDVTDIVVMTQREGFDLSASYPLLSAQTLALGEECGEELFRLHKTQHPAHMHALCKMWSGSCLCGNEVRARLLEILVNRGVLPQPSAQQKRGLNTILFSGVLPE